MKCNPISKKKVKSIHVLSRLAIGAKYLQALSLTYRPCYKNRIIFNILFDNLFISSFSSRFQLYSMPLSVLLLFKQTVIAHRMSVPYFS